MNVTVEDIRSVRPGKTLAFRFESPEKMYSAQSLVSYCNKVKRPLGVKRYKISTNWDDLIITIMAIPEEIINANMMKKDDAL